MHHLRCKLDFTPTLCHSPRLAAAFFDFRDPGGLPSTFLPHPIRIPLLRPLEPQSIKNTLHLSHRLITQPPPPTNRTDPPPAGALVELGASVSYHPHPGLLTVKAFVEPTNEEITYRSNSHTLPILPFASYSRYPSSKPVSRSLRRGSRSRSIAPILVTDQGERNRV
ncbi:hypothetical protein FA13DRAFT_1150372 [Coprinellus micaceus]|uniref:Uncharacterized protein n=1 Tax=Coprinellus micaceus TaxID=71717 RepID=A0A4Y7SUV2_COPMI|nr:hypothetical protein FA13DRAFT_1150372 [Coprinellus micaceus]